MSKKQIKELFKLTYPRIPPYANLTNYHESQNALRSVSFPNFGDLPGADPYIDLSAAHRRFRNAEAALESRREFKKKEKAKLDRQWNEIEQLERTLKENFIELSSFLQTNELKKTRARKHHEVDVKLIESRNKEIENLNKQIEFLKNSIAQIDEQNSQHLIYETYLRSVIEESGEFGALLSIIDRYESLIKTKIELGDRQQQTLDILEKAKNNLSKMTDENNFRILGMSNILTNLQERYQTILSKSLRWEKLVYNIKNTSLQKFMEIYEVKLSCRNIYGLMCERKGEEPKIPDDNFEGQLLYIKKTLRQLATARAQAVKAAKKPISSVKVETSKS